MIAIIAGLATSTVLNVAWKLEQGRKYSKWDFAWCTLVGLLVFSVITLAGA